MVFLSSHTRKWFPHLLATYWAKVGSIRPLSSRIGQTGEEQGAYQVALVSCLPMQETWETQVWPPESGRSPGGGHGNPLQYSCLENPTDRGAWQATVHRGAKSLTRLKRLSTHTHEETDSSVVFHYATLHLFTNLTSIYFIPHYSMNLQAVDFQRCEHVCVSSHVSWFMYLAYIVTCVCPLPVVMLLCTLSYSTI